MRQLYASNLNQWCHIGGFFWLNLFGIFYADDFVFGSMGCLDIIVSHALLLTQKLSSLLSGPRSTKKITQNFGKGCDDCVTTKFPTNKKTGLEFHYRTTSLRIGFISFSFTIGSAIVVRGDERVQKPRVWDVLRSTARITKSHYWLLTKAQSRCYILTQHPLP